jgi:hypothetical protein
MRKSLFLVIALVAILMASGCTQTGQVINAGPDAGAAGSADSGKEMLSCPASCSDNDPCTQDTCGGETDFSCAHAPLTGTECGQDMTCDEGKCVSSADLCTTIYRTYGKDEGDSCYDEKYIGPAVKAKDASLCGGMMSAYFTGVCYGKVAYAAKDSGICGSASDKPADKEGYLDGVSARDECYMHYATEVAQKTFIFDAESCAKIVNAEMKTQCEGFLEYVTAPVEIKEFFVGISNDPASPPKKIVSYMILRDRKGRTAVGDGKVTVYISQPDEKGKDRIKLFYETYDVSEEDFKPTNVGGFAVREEIAYVFPSLEAEDLLEMPAGNTGSVYITFTPEGGTPFSTSENLDFGL